MTLLGACMVTKDISTYKLIPAQGDTPAICMEYTDTVQVIEPERMDNGQTEAMDGTCPVLINNQKIPAKTEVLCSKDPKPVSLSNCGVLVNGHDIRGLKKDGDLTVCYSKTFQTILPWNYCLPDTEVNVQTQVSQISVQSARY